MKMSFSIFVPTILLKLDNNFEYIKKLMFKSIVFSFVKTNFLIMTFLDRLTKSVCNTDKLKYVFFIFVFRIFVFSV